VTPTVGFDFAVASGGNGVPSVPGLRDALDDAWGGEDAHPGSDWVALDRTVTAVEQAARAQPGPEVAALAEYGITLLTTDGADRDRRLRLAERLLAAHALACRAGAVHPHRLAEWLLYRQVDHPDGPPVPLADYLSALGEDGLAAYRAGAEALCDALPVVGFGEAARYDRRRWAVLRVVDELARHTGDVDLRVRSLATDLSSGWHYLRVAGVLQEEGRVEQALEWVQRGLRMTGKGPARLRLIDVAVDECLRVGWFDRAMELRERAFRESPDLATYLRLRGLAGRTEQWPQRRESLLRPLHEGAAQDVRHSTALVRILLWEGEQDAAWRAAQRHGCSDDAWQALAEERAERHPGEAIAVYRDLVEHELAEEGEDDGRVADMLEQLRVLFTRTGQPDAFSRYLDGIKSRHTTDRELLDELSRRGL
jgi:tetratricopeptide (TPR) repeat protein